jgi:hypothetical protein
VPILSNTSSERHTFYGVSRAFHPVRHEIVRKGSAGSLAGLGFVLIKTASNNSFDFVL